MAMNIAPDAHDTPLDLLLTNMVGQVAQVSQAIVLSQDGLVVSKSTSMPRSDAERLAATACGLVSLSRGVCTEFGGEAFVQALIEMRQGYLILTSAGPGAYLAVLCGPQADIGVIAFEMNLLVERIGDHLGAPPRTTEAHAAPSGGAPTG